METTIINPDDLVKPRGYNHGIRIPAASSLLFMGGQVAWDTQGRLVGEKNVALQFDKALENILTVVRAAGGTAASIVKLNVYVTDKKAYTSCTSELAQAYRKHMGKHFPTMTLVEVKSLYESGAMVEIEGVAVL